PGARALRHALAQSDRRERRLDHVRGPEMLPVLGGEVEEREQDIGVLLRRRDGLRVLRAVLGGEPRNRLARLRAGLGVYDVVERGLHAGLEALRELVEYVAELWNQSRCSRVFGHMSRTAAQKPRAPSPTAIPGGRILRRFRSRSALARRVYVRRLPEFDTRSAPPAVPACVRRAEAHGGETHGARCRPNGGRRG